MQSAEVTGDSATELSESEQRLAEERTAPRAAVIHEAIRAEGESELQRPINALTWSGLAAGLSIGKKLENEERGRDCYYAERRFGAFTRVIPLPSEVDVKKGERQIREWSPSRSAPKGQSCERHADRSSRYVSPSANCRAKRRDCRCCTKVFTRVLFRLSRVDESLL